MIRLQFATTPLLVILLAGCLSGPGKKPANRPAPELPGQKADGSVLLPNLWSLRPVGKQIVLGDFPVNIAVHPKGEYAAILHSGHGRHQIMIVQIATAQVTSSVNLEETFYGLEFSRDGARLVSSGAGDEVLHLFSFKDGYLGDHRQIPLRDVKERGIPAGLAINEDMRRIFVANVWGHRITRVDLNDPAVATDISILTNFPPPVITRIKPPSDPDAAAITKRAEALLDETKASDPFPYACRLDEKRRRLYVSLWAQSSIAVIDLDSNKLIARWPTEEHPNEMLLNKAGQILYVANANRNTVTALSTDDGHTLETISSSLHPNSPPGSTPNSLACSPDEKTLFVANSGNNTVAVFDISSPGRSRSLGLIPVGWYPTSVRVTPNGKQLLVANGKGIIPEANRHGPQPGQDPPASVREYIGGLFRGTLSVIDLPARDKFVEQLKDYTARAYACVPKTNLPPGVLAASPIVNTLEQPSPIKYCFYVIKENRTYDQVLGDLPQGNGDPSLCLFPENVTPNHHKLAREFVLLDNFYVDGEVSADGHEWSMGAYASDFVEKFWPLSYGHNKSGKYPYPAEGNFPIAIPAGGYLWDRAREAGVSYRSYGEFIANGKTATDPGRTRVAALEGHFDPWYRSFDMDYPDAKRVDRFISELKRFEAEGDMPRLQIVRLPNDHTSGTAAGKLTPRALVADNDLAFGRFVEAVSHSKFWPQTAIFVVEDDAQNGPDHVDAHRTIAFVISPYVRRASVDSTMYSTSSMLRTMEMILGLKPMSQFDAAAMPMFNSFQAKPDVRPYQAAPVTVDMTERNTKLAWGSDLSKKMDFTKEDAADDLLLNEVIWRSIKGPTSKMPAPRRAAFVFPHSNGDHDDD